MFRIIVSPAFDRRANRKHGLFDAYLQGDDAGVFILSPPGLGSRVRDRHERHTKWIRRRPMARVRRSAC